VLLSGLVLTLLSLPAWLTAAQQPNQAQQNQASTPAGQEIIQKEQALWQAIRNKDRAAIDSMTGPTAIFVGRRGLQTKWEFMNATLPQLNLQSGSPANFQVRMPGADTRIVVSQVNQSGTMAGQPVAPTIWVTTVWYNQGGTWLVVSHQVTPAG
jgi:hypothetical protein